MILIRQIIMLISQMCSLTLYLHIYIDSNLYGLLLLFPWFYVYTYLNYESCKWTMSRLYLYKNYDIYISIKQCDTLYPLRLHSQLSLESDPGSSCDIQ